MRLFVAVRLDETVRRAAEQVAEEMRRRLGSALQAKWVSVANMHLTVRFIGHVEDDRVPGVLDALRPPLGLAPFDVALGDGGIFPPHGPPRVLWIGLKEGLPSLHAMHDIFDRRLRPLGFQPETRPFGAHLTLARVKDAPRGSGAAARDVIRAIRVPPARCRISEAVIFESRLSPGGACYDSLQPVPLQP